MQRTLDHVFSWSDEKILRVEPVSVMVWAAVASDGSKSRLVFIEEGVEVNRKSVTLGP